ncbi:MAG: cytochrome b N-terminal domain-containing protein [Gammaproteobacteria bacterium]|nr:cytochrome b N-terminal domain-containing protein [Gammaproteobacteria bacterium]
MAAIKRTLSTLFGRAESIFAWAFGRHNNPLACLGALGWYFFWIVAASGIYLYLFFDTGITNAYASVERMTHSMPYTAGIMRSLHRYASDALVIVVALHLLREFSRDRMRGKRFFAWVTGVIALGIIYVCGITGYWLVWDQLAQVIAVAMSEWLDTLPIFGQPIANNFLNSSTLGDRFFTLMVFMHIFAPLFLLLLMWIHIQRHSRARVNPPRRLAIGTFGALFVLALLSPATSHAPADLDQIPAAVQLDWFYLPTIPLLDIVPGGQLWLWLVGGGVALVLLPWLPPLKSPPAAEVNLDNCNGCARCFDDCPYSAISMMPRSDGMAFELEAVVNTDNCLSCGICAGACPTSTPFRRASGIVPGIELPDARIADLRDRSIAASSGLKGDSRVLVYSCGHCGDDDLTDAGTAVVRLPCVGMLPPAFIDFVLSRQHVDGVFLSGCAKGDCHFRLGDRWTRQRILGLRDPYLRKRVPVERLSMSWLPRHALRARRETLALFRRSLPDLQPVSVKRRQRD